MGVIGPARRDNNFRASGRAQVIELFSLAFYGEPKWSFPEGAPKLMPAGWATALSYRSVAAPRTVTSDLAPGRESARQVRDEIV